MPDAEYNRITEYTYNKPSHPIYLKISENTPLHEAIIMRELHNYKLNLFLETAAIESAIKSQIVAAIKPIYLKKTSLFSFLHICLIYYLNLILWSYQKMAYFMTNV